MADNDRNPPEVIQYCSSLGQACGISTYTEMLCESQGMLKIKKLKDLEGLRPKYLHVQHEFSIMSLTELRRVINFCRVNNARFYITMHSVVLIPTLSLSYILFELLIDAASILSANLEKVILMIDKYSWAKEVKFYNFFIKAKTSVRRFIIKSNSRAFTVRHKTKIDSSLQKQMIVPGIFRIDWLLHLYRSQRVVIESADKIIVHSDLARQALLLVGAKRVEVVAHAAKEFATSAHRNSELDGKLHVGFFGFLSRYKLLPEVIAACKQIDNLVLHIFSSINHLSLERDHSGCLKILEEIRGYDWLKFETRHLPLQEIVYNLSKNDVNIWATDESPFISISGSIRQYIAAKRPIIAFDNVMISDIRELLTIVPAHDTQKLVWAILNFDPNTEKIGQYLKSHTWDIVKTTYD